MEKFILIDKKDNVVTALKDIKEGVILHVKKGDEILDIALKERIRFGHKCAIAKISKGKRVIKYGESIGVASKDIECGTHVHTHNLRSIRGTVKKG